MKNIPCMLLNQQLKETVPCGSDSFPIQYYVDNLSHWSNQTVPLHWHPQQEFFSVTTGIVDVQIGSKHVQLSEGQTIFINGNLLHSYKHVTEMSNCICPNILFSGTLIAPITSDIYNKYLLPILYYADLPYIVFTSDIEWHQQLLETLFHVYTLLSKYGAEGYYLKNPDDFLPKDKVFSDCFELDVLQDLCQIFKLLYLHKDELPRTDMTKSEMTSQIRLKIMLRYIESHFSEKLSIEKIASSANISRSEADRCFQKYYQLSPMKYVIRHRIEYAKHLLRSTSLSVKEIGFQCGFQDTNYFVKTFRKHMLITPSEYKKISNMKDSKNECSNPCDCPLSEN